jgi:hypothetical protein
VLDAESGDHVPEPLADGFAEKGIDFRGQIELDTSAVGGLNGNPTV